MTSDPVHYLSLIEVSGRLRRGELKPTTLSETILARIARHDGALKSYTTLLADRAMAKARQAEDELNRGLWRGPLHGVPIAVKDLCYTDYAPTAAGMFIHKDFIPPYTCTVVERLERAGAIILGKLSMTEGAFATHHPGMPTPVNPWHADLWWIDVRDGEQVLVALDDAAFADAVVALLADEPRRVALGRAARVWAETNVEWRLVTAAYDALYASLS